MPTLSFQVLGKELHWKILELYKTLKCGMNEKQDALSLIGITSMNLLLKFQ